LAELVTAVEREPVPAVNLPAKQCERDRACAANGDVAQSVDFDSGHEGVLALDGPHRAGAGGGGRRRGEQQQHTRDHRASPADHATVDSGHCTPICAGALQWFVRPSGRQRRCYLLPAGQPVLAASRVTERLGNNRGHREEQRWCDRGPPRRANVSCGSAGCAETHQVMYVGASSHYSSVLIRLATTGRSGACDV
jgi:hypothetical protein